MEDTPTKSNLTMAVVVSTGPRSEALLTTASLFPILIPVSAINSESRLLTVAIREVTHLLRLVKELLHLDRFSRLSSPWMDAQSYSLGDK
jgi:hypothetical protein